jgi:flavin-dependent dehydrogenase
LARRGIDALILERTDGGGNPIGETLDPSANPLLQRMGLAGALPASRALPCYGNRSAWGGDGSLAERDFLRDPYGHGWHLARPGFNAALLEIVAEAGARVWRQSRVVSLKRIDRAWRIGVETAGGVRLVTADSVIDATGRAGLASRWAGVRRRVFDRQVATVAFFAASPHPPAPLSSRWERGWGEGDTTTLVEAARDGWWYSALLPGGRLVVAWFTDPDLLAAQRAWRPEGWRELLARSEATRQRVTRHGGTLPDSIRVTAAGSALLPHVAGEGWVAAGDAAAAFDPLSSHGIGSALASGRRAAEAIAATLAGDDGAFSAYTDHLLASYARYLVLRHAYYAEERRWPDAPFWARRHAGIGVRGEARFFAVGQYRDREKVSS